MPTWLTDIYAALGGNELNIWNISFQISYAVSALSILETVYHVIAVLYNVIVIVS